MLFISTSSRYHVIFEYFAVLFIYMEQMLMLMLMYTAASWQSDFHLLHQFNTVTLKLKLIGATGQ